MTREPRFVGLRRALQLRVGPRSIEREVDAELRFHLDTRRDELVARGVPPDEAADKARQEFGDLTGARRDLVKVDRRRRAHESRAAWTDAAVQDLRLALRRLRATPALTLAIVLTLAIGIGTNAAMFRIADRLLFEPPAAVADPQGLATIVFHQYSSFEHALNAGTVSNYPTFAALDSVPAIAGLAVRSTEPLGAALGSAAWRAQVEFVSPDYFKLLGARPQAGRLFSPAADSSRATPGVVISDRLWRTRFGQDPTVIGRLLRIGRAEFPIIGIAGVGFTGAGLNAVDCWLPASEVATLGLREDWKTPNSFWLTGVVRIAHGASWKATESQLTTAFRRWLAVDPSHPQTGQAPDTLSFVQLEPITGLRDQDAGRSPAARVAAWLAMLSTLVLLIACANVAGLLLVRSMRRSREFALCRALGMSRSRLLGQLLIESAVLAILGAFAAILCMHWSMPLLRDFVAPGVLWAALPLRADIVMATATMGGVIIVTLASAVFPARLLSRTDTSAELKPTGKTALPGRSRAQAVLVASQIAICLVLLAVAGVFVQSLRRVRGMDYGMNLDVIAAELSLHADAPAVAAVRLQRTLRVLQRTPGVEDVTVTDASPFHNMWGGGISLPGRSQASLPRVSTGGPYAARITPGYFATVGTPLVRGRSFVPSDTLAGAAPVLIVSESLARLYWPGQDPIGKCAYFESSKTCSTVVGVSRDMLRMFVREEPRLEIYVPRAGLDPSPRDLTVLIRAAHPTATLPAIRHALQQIDPSAPWPDVGMIRSRVDPQTQSWLLGARMMSGFALLALILSALGLYGVVSYMIASRAHEIGVRIAIGASRASVIGLFVRRALAIVLAGLLVGSIGSVVVLRRVADLLFHTAPTDPAALATAASVLLLAGLAASLVPARRAAAGDPLEALRAE